MEASQTRSGPPANTLKVLVSFPFLVFIPVGNKVTYESLINACILHYKLHADRVVLALSTQHGH